MSGKSAFSSGSSRVTSSPASGRDTAARWVHPIVAVLIVVAIWDIAIRVFGIRPFVLPSPLAVMGAAAADFPGLMSNSWVTLQEVLAGFALSVLVGVPLSVLIASWPLAERAIYPLLVGSQVVPKIAIAPLFIIWFGFGIVPKIVIAFLVAFLPIVIDTVVGLRSVEIEKIYLARSMGASPLQVFFKIRLPSAMPSIFGGLKLAITLAVTGAVVGEFIGADRGLGRVIVVANGSLDTSTLFAAVIVLSLMGVTLFLLIDALERVAIRWHVSQRDVHGRGS